MKRTQPSLLSFTAAVALAAVKVASPAAVAAPEPRPALFPSLADPAPALMCTGTSRTAPTVLCVDGAAAALAPDGTAEQPFVSIGAALVEASAGTVIQVAAGEYAERIELAGVDDVQLVGGFPAGDFSRRDPAAFETVIRGDAENAVVAVIGSTAVVVDGFRLTGGGGHFDGYRAEGGGVFVDYDSSDVTIVGNHIDGNAVDRGPDPTTGLGGGIHSYGAGLRIVGNVIESNRAGRGAGISVVGEATIDGNIVRENVSVGDHGGGLYLAGIVTVTGNHVEGNSVGVDLGYGWGGGIIVFNDDSEATLTGNVVTGNVAPGAGSGVFIDDGADATLLNELYFANECPIDGGAGLLVDSGGATPTAVSVISSTIAQHDCPDAYLGGNAILAESSEAGDPQPVVTVVSSIMWGNQGRDVVAVGATVDVTYSITEEQIDGEGNLHDDPLFADPASGDFHVQSTAGRVDAATGELVLDAVSSPAIDAGDPSAAFSTEPEPNGGRIDMGHTGNTTQASRSS